MAHMKDNNATHGIRGKVNQFVYRQRYGETVVSKLPVRTAPYSEQQKNIVSTFKQAVLYARTILQNAAIQKAYKEKAKRGQSAFNLAIADYFKPPVIVSVDLGQLANQAGSKITALVTDNFRVETVKVRIEKSDGTLIEEGNAAIQPDGLNWQYTTTTANGNNAGNKLLITATDLPGHSITEQKTI